MLLSTPLEAIINRLYIVHKKEGTENFLSINLNGCRVKKAHVKFVVIK